MVLVVYFPYKICYTHHVTLIGKNVIAAFAQTHADAREPLAAWYHEVTNATWRTPKDIKARYPSASILPGRVVIFNIKGNHYRLEVCVAYNTGVVRIDYVGTHADYDKRNRQRGAK